MPIDFEIARDTKEPPRYYVWMFDEGTDRKSVLGSGDTVKAAIENAVGRIDDLAEVKALLEAKLAAGEVV